MRLVELTEQYQNVLESIEAACDEGGVVPPELMAVLDGIQDSMESKLAAYAGMIKSLSAQRDIVKAESERLARQGKSAGDHIDFLKARAKAAMELAGLEKLTVGLRSLRIQKNGMAALVIPDEAVIADNFWMQPPKVIDRDAIRNAIAEGIPVDGAELVKGTHLRCT